MQDNMQDNPYPLGIELGAETARLVDQDVVLTRNMGALFPEPPNADSEWSVLDLACGPGCWALEVAHGYPEGEANPKSVDQVPSQTSQRFALRKGFRVMSHPELFQKFTQPLLPRLLAPAALAGGKSGGVDRLARLASRSTPPLGRNGEPLAARSPGREPEQIPR